MGFDVVLAVGAAVAFDLDGARVDRLTRVGRWQWHGGLQDIALHNALDGGGEARDMARFA